MVKLCYMCFFPGGSDGKESICSAGDRGSTPGSGRSSGGRNGNPLQLPREARLQRSLAGYSPWGHKEMDMTEQLILSLSLYMQYLRQVSKYSYEVSTISIKVHSNI